MALLTIQTPHDAPSLKPLAVGIDLGTTHSLIAFHSEQGTQILADEHGEILLPSVVQYLSHSEHIVGQQAKTNFSHDPVNTIVSAKRQLGRVPFISTDHGNISPIEVSATILKTLMNRAQRLHSNMTDAVITVPAYFDETQRQATKQAAELAGIRVLRLLNEPTAAAVAYGLDEAAEGTCLVFDLGGGTFDVSLLHLNRGIFEVVATGGDAALGGDDMDQLVMQRTGLGLMCARAAKECLSRETRAEFSLSCGTCVSLTRSELDELIAPLVDKMMRICQNVLRDAQRTIHEIDHVILVGGATRVPFIQKRVKEFFGKEPLCRFDPDQVVAMGASIQASILSGHYRRQNVLLLDVIPLSLGVEMMGGLVEKIILRNTPIPAVASQVFTTYADGQTGLVLHVVQGERDTVENCRSLAHFELNGIPPMPAGKAKIEVTFKIDADGLLSVFAKEQLSGVHSEITVKPTFGLTDRDIIDCVEGSLANEEQDKLTRKWRQKKNEAEQLLHSIDKSLTTLPNDERHALYVGARNQLQEALMTNDYASLHQVIQAIEPFALELAEKQLNAALQKVVAGKSVNELETLLL